MVSLHVLILEDMKGPPVALAPHCLNGVRYVGLQLVHDIWKEIFYKRFDFIVKNATISRCCINIFQRNVTTTLRFCVSVENAGRMYCWRTILTHH